MTLAGRYQMFDALIMHSKRHGHELENYDYKNGRDIQGKEREKADPYTITKESTLVKFSFRQQKIIVLQSLLILIFSIPADMIFHIILLQQHIFS